MEILKNVAERTNKRTFLENVTERTNKRKLEIFSELHIYMFYLRCLTDYKVLTAFIPKLPEGRAKAAVGGQFASF